MDQWSGRVALVTGSAGGIGLGIARAFVEAGMRVALADIDEPTLDAAATELRRTGARVVAVRLDVTDRDNWARAARDVSGALGPVQLLVNNAGVSTLGLRFGDVDPDLWDRVVRINLTGAYNGVHQFLDGMRTAGGGHIVNTSSMAGLYGVPALAPYAATKFALVGLSEVLRAELADSGIGVSVLCPGPVRSRLWRTSRAVRGLPDSAVPPSDPSAQSADPTAMDPDDVGRRVLRGVVANEPYIFTHPEYRAAVARRHAQLLHAFDLAASFDA